MRSLKQLLVAVSVASLTVPAAAQMVGGFDNEQFVRAIRDQENSKALELMRAQPRLVNMRAMGGTTALIVAVENRDAEWIAFLLQSDANPNLAATNGDTPLLVAARIGEADATRLLLKQGGKVDQANRMGETPLIVAVQQRRPEIVEILLAAGANPDITDSAAGYSARDYAKRDNRNPELLRLIEKKKPKP